MSDLHDDLTTIIATHAGRPDVAAAHVAHYLAAALAAPIRAREDEQGRLYRQRHQAGHHDLAREHAIRARAYRDTRHRMVESLAVANVLLPPISTPTPEPSTPPTPPLPPPTGSRPSRWFNRRTQ